MQKALLPLAILGLALAGCVAPAVEAPAPTPAAESQAAAIVGGAPMDPALPIVRNTANSRDHTTLVSAVRSAGLEQTLDGAGPFTLFAPTDDAFARLPNGTLESLTAPSSRSLLAGLVNYHLVPGRKTRADIANDARSGGGTAVYRTAHGGIIRVSVQGGTIIVSDNYGNRGTVRQADVSHSNGVMHVTDTVLIPPV